ncbi:MAG: ABC-2 transporter permease [Propionibacteriaceae bacterium]|nr:ABC-2 transporter permease [Propionibacteriaceae bacterium]
MSHLPAQVALELWVLRPFARQFVMLSGIAVLFVSFHDAGPAMAVAMAALTGSYGFAITETAHLETLFATLPSTRRDVVVARYLVITGILLAAGLLGVVVDAIKAAVTGQPWSLGGTLAVVAMSFAVAAAVIAIQFPFFFRLGYLRARFLTFVTIAAVAALIVALVVLASTSGVAPGWLEAMAHISTIGFTVGGMLVGFGFLIASAALSVHLYAQKDL